MLSAMKTKSPLIFILFFALDPDSWTVTGGTQDAPALFDASYNKKSAFTEFIKRLQ